MTVGERIAVVAALLAEAAGVVAAVHALLVKKRNPSGALVWILVCLSLPLAGAALYLTIGYDRVSKRRRRFIRASHREFFAERRTQRASSRGTAARAAAAAAAPLQRLAEAEVRAGNSAEILVGGAVAYARMLDAIGLAQRHVFLQTYIFDADESGRRFVDALRERARAGVVVRVLYDAVGTSSAGARLLRALEEGEGRVASFSPFHPLKRRFQINLRNHRKILVVDDEIGFTGSMNVSDRHLSDDRCGSRDMMVEMGGPIVDDLSDVFAADWLFASDEKLRIPPQSPRDAGEESLQLFESGPDRVDRGVKLLILSALYAAKRDVLVVTPYFVPPPELLTAFQTASARGVRVRLLVPGRNNHALIHWATRSFLSPLLRTGVRVAERPGPLLHMKLLVVDDDIAVFGSSNLDHRSFYLNFEADVAAYGGALQAKLREVAEAEWRAAEPVSEERFEKLPLWERLGVRAAALFSPVL